MIEDKNRIDEELEVQVSAKADDAELLAEYTRLVLGDNIDFFDQEFNAEDEKVEVSDDFGQDFDDPDDMSDDEFFEAFGKAMKEKHDKVLQESDELQEGEFGKTLKGIGQKIKNAIGKVADKAALATQKFDYLDDTKKFGVRLATKEGDKVNYKAMLYDRFKDAETAAKKHANEAGKFAAIYIAELTDRYSDIYAKYSEAQKPIDPKDTKSWMYLCSYENGKMVEDVFAAANSLVQKSVDKYKNANKETFLAGEEVEDTVDNEQSAEEPKPAEPAPQVEPEKPAEEVKAEEPVKEEPKAEEPAKEEEKKEEPAEEEKPAEEPAEEPVKEESDDDAELKKQVIDILQDTYGGLKRGNKDQIVADKIAEIADLVNEENK